MTELLIFGALALGVLASLAITRWLERRERRYMNENWMEIASHHETYGRILEKDPARLGIDQGVYYATRKMRDTIDELENRQ